MLAQQINKPRDFRKSQEVTQVPKRIWQYVHTACIIDKFRKARGPEAINQLINDFLHNGNAQAITELTSRLSGDMTAEDKKQFEQNIQELSDSLEHNKTTLLRCLHDIGLPPGDSDEQNRQKLYQLTENESIPDKERMIAWLHLGVFYERDENYQQAHQCYLEAWEKGSAGAAFKLGKLFDKGYYVTQNSQKAYDYYMEAAEKDNTEALFKLGTLHESGCNGVEQDSQKAYWYYRRAAEKGHAAALCSLGELYEQGKGVTQNYQQAFKLYHQSANSNLARAYRNLAELHNKGLGNRSLAGLYRWRASRAEKQVRLLQGKQTQSWQLQKLKTCLSRLYQKCQELVVHEGYSFDNIYTLCHQQLPPQVRLALSITQLLRQHATVINDDINGNPPELMLEKLSQAQQIAQGLNDILQQNRATFDDFQNDNESIQLIRQYSRQFVDSVNSDYSVFSQLEIGTNCNNLRSQLA